MIRSFANPGIEDMRASQSSQKPNLYRSTCWPISVGPSRLIWLLSPQLHNRLNTIQGYNYHAPDRETDGGSTMWVGVHNFRDAGGY